MGFGSTVTISFTLGCVPFASEQQFLLKVLGHLNRYDFASGAYFTHCRNCR
jgi:hypothetical protein